MHVKCSYIFFTGLQLGILVLKHCDKLAKALQSPKLAISDGRSMARKTVVVLQNLRTDAEYDTFKRKVCELQEQLGTNIVFLK